MGGGIPATGPSDRVVVLGAGQRGLCCVIAARAAGARQVVITGLTRDADKLALARELGADATVDAETKDVASSVREVTGGGAEVVVDTTPYAPQSLNHAIAIAVRKGRIVVAGLKGQKRAQDFAVDSMIYKELTVRGVLSMPVDDTFRAVELIESRRHPIEKLHTYSLPIEQAEDAIRALAGDVPGVNPVHIALIPGAPAWRCPREMGRSPSPVPMELIRPPRLAAGQTIGLVAPSSAPNEPEHIRFAIDTIASLGFRVRPSPHLFDRHGYFAGDDAVRAGDLNAMFADDAIDAVWCVRGGYGASRILPMLDYERIRRAPKALIGFSDITALHMALHTQAGVVSFHGPVACARSRRTHSANSGASCAPPRSRSRVGGPPPFPQREATSI